MSYPEVLKEWMARCAVLGIAIVETKESDGVEFSIKPDAVECRGCGEWKVQKIKTDGRQLLKLAIERDGQAFEMDFSFDHALLPWDDLWVKESPTRALWSLAFEISMLDPAPPDQDLFIGFSVDWDFRSNRLRCYWDLTEYGERESIVQRSGYEEFHAKLGADVKEIILLAETLSDLAGYRFPPLAKRVFRAIFDQSGALLIAEDAWSKDLLEEPGEQREPGYPWLIFHNKRR